MKNSALLVVTLCLLVAPAALAGHHDHSFTSNARDGMRSCDDWDVTMNGSRAIVSSETINVDARGGAQYTITAAPNGGASLHGSTDGTYSVVLCRAVSQSLGNAGLSQIRANRGANGLEITGPEGGEWSAHLIITAPRGANLSISTTNGPLAAESFDGTLAFRAVNGPVTLDKVSGDVHAETTNGPVTLDDASGNVSVRAANGPVSVRLSGAAWQGQGLDARSTNGPLTLSVPKGFSSGVEVRAAGHTPWRCPESLCGDAQKTWNNDDNEETKTIRFGSGATVVQLETENGPVSIKERD